MAALRNIKPKLRKLSKPEKFHTPNRIQMHGIDYYKCGLQKSYDANDLVFWCSVVACFAFVVGFVFAAMIK